MTRFIIAHLLHNGAAFLVIRRQTFEMAFKVMHHLPFGFRQETQIPFVAQQSRHRADRKRPRIKQRIQHTFAAAQLGDTPFGPRQMFGFFLRRLFQRLLRALASRAVSAWP